ncbi:hypothetical protein F4780DRAFT_515681 [Xylariomycetidae sp. FL0641]|nr:hypothetical protein F4780DRAFT_515681 [Xylariomycetidae sp. FL0641]
MRKVYDGSFNANSKNEVEVNARVTYYAYYNDVLWLASSERRLEHRMDSGEEPLYAFVRKEIPDVPFPCANKRGEHSKDPYAGEPERINHQPLT